MDIIQGVVVKFLGKRKDFVCLLEEFCIFILIFVDRQIRKDVVFTGVLKEGFDFFCVIFMWIIFYIVIYSVDNLWLLFGIQKYDYRGVLVIKNIDNLFLFDCGLVQ